MRASLTCIFAVLLWFPLASQASAQDPLLSKAQQIKAHIEEELSYYRPSSGNFTIPQARQPVTVKAWTENGVLRKMTVDAPDDHGATLEELYYKDGVLAYMVETTLTSPMDKSPDRSSQSHYVFADGEMILWLDQKGAARPRDSADFTVHAVQISQVSGLLAAQMTAQRLGQIGPIQHTSGRFAGIEEGDYYYLNLETPNGEGASFFILQTDPTLEALLNSPDAYMGKELMVYWQSMVENIPQAGGDIQIERAVAVRLP
jgi:hypothetical protein